MPEVKQTSDLKGYVTESTHLEASLSQPCSAHYVAGWEERSVRALSEGWPVDGFTGSPHDPECPDCVAMPKLVVDMGIVDWHSNDPRVVDVDPVKGAVLEPNPFKRFLYRWKRRFKA